MAVESMTQRENRLKEDLDCILDNTKELWDELRGGRIFITGGTGFFGCWLLESFAWANEKLNLDASATVLTRNLQAFRKKALHLCSKRFIFFYEGDVCNLEFPPGEFSHIIHAASGADAACGRHASLALFEGIVKGTRRALDFAVQCKAKKFLFTSSGAVYGKQPPDLPRIPEEYSGAPETTDISSAYGEGKRVSEFLTSIYAERYGFEAKIARCFTFVGPYLPLDANFAIGNFIGNVIKNEPVLVKGDGTPYRSYLYAADLAIWLWTILFRGESRRPYNVGSDVEVTIGETAAAVAHFLLNKAVYISKEVSPGRPSERYVPSIMRIQQELGLKQNIYLQEAIRRTISWYT